MQLTDYVCRVSLRRYMLLNLPVSREIVKDVVLGAGFLGGGYTQISHIHFQTALTSEHVAGFR